MNADGPVLRDIHLPPDPDWWPPAPGWWLLLAVALVVVGILVHLLRQRWRHRQWREDVMAELRQITRQHNRAPDPARLLADISQLLRRASRLLDPAAVSLRGDAWLRFLDSVLEGAHFSSGLGRCLLDGPYQREVEVDTGALLDLTRTWLDRSIRKARNG